MAPYAFTTLQPQLGAVAGGVPGALRPLVADLPGLVQGAHADRGLGHDFLKCALACHKVTSPKSLTCVLQA